MMEIRSSIAHFSHHGRTSCGGHQTITSHPQIRERKQRYDLSGVFLESAIANLGKAELPFDHSKRMLNHCPNSRQNPTERFLLFGQYVAS